MNERLLVSADRARQVPSRVLREHRLAGSRAIAASDSRGATTQQSGYVLGVVLAAMTVGLLLITALLALSFTTFRAATMQQQLARDQRAADGGLETALSRVRAVTDPDDPCAVVNGPEFASPIRFEPDTANEVAVRMECDNGIGNSLDPSPDSVELVGGSDGNDDYSSVPGDGIDWLSWPWGDALGTNTPPDGALHPTLVHKGAQRLMINGNLVVRKGSAALIDSGVDAGAIDVSGNYRQGDLGHLGTATPDAECGMLDQGQGSTLGLVDPTLTAVIDSDATPRCDDSDVKGLSGTLVVDGPTGVPGAVPGSWACGSTVAIPAGDYVGAQLDALNSHFDGSCPDTLFKFESGTYWFGATDNGGALEFDDATSAFAFGTVPGSGPSATCDPGAPNGVRIVLSGQTTIDHKAGNVSICAGHDPDGGTEQALVQSITRPSGIVLSNPLVPAPHHEIVWYCQNWYTCWAIRAPDFANVQNVLSRNDVSVANVDCRLADQPCKLRFQVDLNGFGDVPVEDLKLTWNSSEMPRSHLGLRKVTAKVTGGNGVACTKFKDEAGRTPNFMSVLDLTGCYSGGGVVERDFNGAKMTVEFEYRAGWAIYKLGLGERISLSLNRLQLIANSAPVDAKVATSPPGQWSDPSTVLNPGGAATPPPCTAETIEIPTGGFVVRSRYCTDIEVEGTQPNVLSLSDFDVAGSNLDVDDQLAELYLAIDNANVLDGDTVVANQYWDSNDIILGKTRVSVSVPGQDQPCDVYPNEDTFHTYTRSGTTYLIDLMSACPVLRQNASVLSDPATEVQLSMSSEKGSWYANSVGQNPTYHPKSALQLPSLDYVRLVAVTDSSQQRHRSRVTSDGESARFRVYGDVVMPHMSLDVNWNGAYVRADGPDDDSLPDDDTDPIVSGSLQLHSLGSLADADGVVGILCCGAGSIEAQIRAQIQDDGGTWVDRGLARAVVGRSTPGKPLADVIVTGWQLCGNGGCDVPTAASPGPDP